MPNIVLSEAETALWREAGSRGIAFRRAMRERARELADSLGRTEWLVEIVDSDGTMVESLRSVDVRHADEAAARGDARSH